MTFTHYRTAGYFDEMFDTEAQPRAEYRAVARALGRMPAATFSARAALASEIPGDPRYRRPECRPVAVDRPGSVAPTASR
jgi:hypothetical protein